MEGVILIILLLFFLFVAIFCIFMAVKISKLKKQDKLEKKAKIKELNAKEHGVFKHTIGLPLPENTLCDVYYGEDKIVISGGGSTFNLSLSKVNDITITTDVEIQKAYVSSAGGAVAGGLVFGPLGALVGGRAKQKKINQVTNFLVITYMKDEEPSYISFDTTNNFKAFKIVSLFQQQPKTNQTEIEL
ncbi:hypothetical protein [Bacillus sp. FJAT-22090]|uniref:hypothetical protein n=1 Tax=Bacillus sp. FJAT-22090 TaxID=1581038 RepID=UPI0011A2AA96|nr:hypothetical protein [Bacillus sp. FJAT-22090]